MALFDKLMSRDRTLDLKVPDHLIDPTLLTVFGRVGSQPSVMTVFSIWNTMLGSTILSLPWGMSQSGLILGLLSIAFIGALAFYTCKIMLNFSLRLKQDDPADIMEMVWGRKGKVLTLSMSALVLIGAGIAYNIIMNSALFSMMDGISIWSSGSSIGCEACWDQFSTRYTPLIIMGVLFLLLSMKEKNSFVRLNSGGVIFIIITVLAIIAVGIRAFSINTFTTSGSDKVDSDDKSCDDDWNCLKHNDSVHISLVGLGFLKMLGILSLSFFIHNAISIIMKNNAEPQHNDRDLFFGYLSVGLSYTVIGLFGYFGFRGNGFPQGEISQNVMTMWASDNAFAFIMRCIIVVQMFTVYPLIGFIVRTQLLGYFFGSDFPSRKIVTIFSLIYSSTTTLVTITFPQVGMITSVLGALCGLYFIYFLPVLFMYKFNRPKGPEGSLAGKLNVAESDSGMHEADAAEIKKWKCQVRVHSLITVFGVIVLIFQFVPLG
jgi:sodium-coupled neutral amino acid transporter 9